MRSTKHLYRITFRNQGNVYEIYARQVSQGGLYGFIEIEELLFNERSKIVIDPSAEKLQTEFDGVRRMYLPVHAVVRIDEVEREGPARIVDKHDEEGRVSPFPMPLYAPRGEGPGGHRGGGKE